MFVLDQGQLYCWQLWHEHSVLIILATRDYKYFHLGDGCVPLLAWKVSYSTHTGEFIERN